MKDNNKVVNVIRIVGWNFVSLNSNWHLIGFDLKNNSARISSPIVKIELVKNIITTFSGSRYRPVEGPGRLHPKAEIFLKNLSEFDDFGYTVELLSVSNNKKQFTPPAAEHLFQKRPYLEYKSKVFELLDQEFSDIPSVQHHLGWIDDKCIFIGMSEKADEDEHEDQLAVWESFALNHENSKEVQLVFVQQNFAKYSVTNKASKLIRQGDLSEIVIDPSVNLIFTKALWEEVCFLFSEMITNVIADSGKEGKFAPALATPNPKQMISWLVDKSILAHHSKWLSKSLLETFNSHDYITEILKHHYQATNQFNIKYELNANV